MEPLTALSSLLVWAQVLGVDATPAPLPEVRAVAVAEAPAQPQVILTLPLKEIVADAERAFTWQPVGRGAIGVSVGFDPLAEVWVKFKQDRVRSAHSLTSLAKGVTERFPVETYKFTAEKDTVTAFPVQEPQTPQATASVQAMLRQVYTAAAHVQVPLVEYAVLFEEERQGSAIPASVSLMREDRYGNFWITYGTAAEAAKGIKWFVGVNGVIYGMRLEGSNLVFYSKVLPPEKFSGGPELQPLLPETRVPR
ncbi:MAG: hypothetical protein HY924_13625 [Elusimicrobia bacterium]|nr:hypothetical protein [Elusimicrobiota bacterium]